MKHRLILLLLPMALLFLNCKPADKGPQDTEKDVASVYWAHRFSSALNIQYGEHPEQRLDIYSQGSRVGEPDWWIPDSEVHPTLVFIHGGGWVGGRKEGSVLDFIPYLQKGWNVVNVEYRKGENTAPEAVQDVLCALKWIGEHPDRFNIDLENIVLSGDSAGGHLALIVGLLNSKQDNFPCYAGGLMTVKAIVNWYGITDIKEVENYLKTYKPEWNYASSWLRDSLQTDSISRKYSPVNHISKASPPIISIHGKLDSVVPYSQAVALHELLNQQGVKNMLVTDPEGKHVGFSETQYQKNYNEIFDFLQEVGLPD
ncbi:alpha/beta hydrolase fold domain-containing protein [Robiginitalea sp. IMCC44478]|uniref:alpha/beta hydrolase fold domain-containing protein n=1 Tax=Robiginitalea sp. IMCC44478 TaxID=3459122 RepID=UPI0040416A33